MKIFSCEQIKKIDEYTIKNEPIASVDLMERAAGQILIWYMDKFERSKRIFIFAGPGNNGGDGLALARLLEENRYKPQVHYVHFSETTSTDWEVNRKRLEKETSVPFEILNKIDDFPVIYPDDVIIDAIFGSGLSRPADGLAAEVIAQINKCNSAVISIDIPSGLFGEDNSSNDPEKIINADFTLSFQFPKLSFMFSENGNHTGKWIILPIGLNTSAINNTNTPFVFLEKNLIAPLLKSRNKFDHKGNFGHGLLIGGSYGKIGAVVLGAKAALRTGIGLISCHIPSCGNIIMQTAVPEAMIIHDNAEKYITDIGSTELFSSVGIGPGMGTVKESHGTLHNLLKNCKKPVVIDADALNIISANKDWISDLPAGSVLTPHPKEFERLAGKTGDGFSRMKKQMEFSKDFNCFVILKGAFTSITSPDGKVWFNSTGNPGMATAGSGDVLTGMILSFLAQGYTPEHAAVVGVYLHGLAGDIAAEKSSFESIIASDIIYETGAAFNRIRTP
ncbi:MAG: NAD(P)H-hydrate dehydratase [Bacteroidales bacterium]|nr:NAD(P)H-hydrate dehydratase [Bacteroidales bacterium]